MRPLITYSLIMRKNRLLSQKPQRKPETLYVTDKVNNTIYLFKFIKYVSGPEVKTSHRLLFQRQQFISAFISARQKHRTPALVIGKICFKVSIILSLMPQVRPRIRRGKGKLGIIRVKLYCKIYSLSRKLRGFSWKTEHKRRPYFYAGLLCPLIDLPYLVIRCFISAITLAGLI